MEDLQSTLQSILSDPEQMRRITAMAESLGLKPPGDGMRNAESGSKDQGAEAAGGGAPTPRRVPMREGTENGEQANFSLENLDLSAILGSLSAMNGAEDRVFAALRPSLSPAGQGKADRALRAAKLSRLAGRFLTRQRDGHV